MEPAIFEPRLKFGLMQWGEGAPIYACPTERLRWGTHGGGALLILLLLAFPFLRLGNKHSTLHCVELIPMGRTRGGRTPGSPPLRVSSLKGGLSWRGSFNITSACMSLPQAIYILHCIALHSPKLKHIKRIEIYSDSQQSPSKLCLIKYCIKNPCFPFWKLKIFIFGFSTKVPP